MVHGRARPRLAAILVASLLALGCMTSPAWAAPGAVQALPGCDTQLPANDDGSTDDAVPLGFTVTVGDRAADAVYVNNNGNVTFGQSLSDYTPYDFRGSSVPMIAPFFADVDTRGAGNGTVKYGQVTYDGRSAFCVTWDHVGYYDQRTDKVNTFQIVIVDRGADGIDLVFNYDAIQWETGDADQGADGLGGTSATAGYSAGDGNPATARLFPGSFVNGALIDGGANSLAAGSTAGQPAGRYVFRVGPTPGSRLSGQVLAPAESGGDPQPGAPVQICPHAGGPCVTRIADGDGTYRASGLAAGDYDLTAFAGDGPPYRSGSATVHLDGSAAATQDIVLGPAPEAPPEGTTITSIDTSPDGIPVAYWEDPLTLTTQGCPGGTATYTATVETVHTGSMTEGPAGRYSATLAPFAPEHGNAEVQIHIDCPDGTPDEDVDFGVYIDPSGIVRDSAGNPADGATVTLLSSTTPDGPFFPVADGSTMMSPSNRDNPDFTGADGRFGWDVVAGYYLVRATRGDCSAQSAVLTIPPPVTNLDLRLTCPSPGGGGTPPPPSGGPVVVTTQPPPSGGPVVVTTQQPPAQKKKGKKKARKLVTVRSARLVHGRTLAVGIACAKSARQSCKGSVRVRIGKRTVGKGSFKRVKHGKAATVKVKLTRKGRAMVSKAHGKKVRMTIAVTVRDRRGAGRPVQRTVKVRRR